MQIKTFPTVSQAILGISGLVLSGYTTFSLINNVPKANAATPCIVTIFGHQYDVAPLQPIGTHPGGNVFVCGTDMTAAYQAIHGTDVTRIASFILVAPTPSPSPAITPTPTVTVTPTPTPTVTITPTPSPSPFEDDEEELEDNETEHDEFENTNDDSREDDHEDHDEVERHRDRRHHLSDRERREDREDD